MYSVHRINPQCVLTNITQLPPDWFVSVGEARSAPVPAPIRSPPTGTETAGRRSFVSGADTHSHAIKKQRMNLGLGWERAARDLMLSSEAGMGREMSFVYNQVRSLWLMLVPQEGESGLRQSTVTWEDAHIPVLNQDWRNKKKTGLSNLKCSNLFL